MDTRKKRGEGKENLTAYGATKSAEEWCKITGQNPLDLQGRIYNKHMTPEEMLTLPMRYRNTDNVTYQAFGQALSLKDWAKKLNKHYSTLTYRIHHMKMPIEEALMKDSAPRKEHRRDKKSK